MTLRHELLREMGRGQPLATPRGQVKKVWKHNLWHCLMEDDKLYVSRDEGKTWQLRSEGLHPALSATLWAILVSFTFLWGYGAVSLLLDSVRAVR